jgi:hypothetical protein
MTVQLMLENPVQWLFISPSLVQVIFGRYGEKPQFITEDERKTQVRLSSFNKRHISNKDYHRRYFNCLRDEAVCLFPAPLFLGAFRKISKSDYWLRHVCPSVLKEHSSPNGRIFNTFTAIIDLVNLIIPA